MTNNTENNTHHPPQTAVTSGGDAGAPMAMAARVAAARVGAPAGVQDRIPDWWERRKPVAMAVTSLAQELAARPATHIQRAELSLPISVEQPARTVGKAACMVAVAPE